MKKVLVFIAVLLVAVVPLAVLISLGAESAVPDAYIGETAVNPYTVRWTFSGESEPSDTRSVTPEEFRENIVQVPRSSAFSDLTFSKEPTELVFLPLEGDGSTYSRDTVNDALPTGEPSVVLAFVTWKVVGSVTVRAGYVFEVTP